jgi:two-component system invasion response regulator UvrY
VIRILIADDHAVVREGLKRILAETEGMKVVAEAADGPEVFTRLEETECDVVVLDVSMPGMSGVEVLRRLQRERPGVRVLVLSVHPEDQYAVRVLRAGAAGYLTKESAPEELVTALKEVRAGGRYLTATLAEKLADGRAVDRERPAHEVLSNREYEVLRMFGSGKTVSEIASELGLSVKTVSTYRTRILEKLRLRTTAEIIRYAVDQGLAG